MASFVVSSSGHGPNKQCLDMSQVNSQLASYVSAQYSKEKRSIVDLISFKI